MNILAVVLTGFALMAGLWMVMKPPAEPVPVDEATLHEFRFEMKAGVILGPENLRVQEGDRVRIEFHSDAADELHLHGYDLHGHVKPDSPLVLSFDADKSGRFELELHRAQHAIGGLEVYPRP